MPEKSSSYPTIPDEHGDDLHGLEDIEAAELVVFMAGNQFMAMADLMTAFRDAHPGIGPIYYETLPPIMELRQILAGGAMFRGRFIDARADVYTSVSELGVDTLSKADRVDRDACTD